MHPRPFLLAAALVCVPVFPSSAQDYWTLERIRAQEAADAAGPQGTRPLGVPQYASDPLAQMLQEAQFLVSLQQLQPGSDFGGMKEGETLLDIIQTDNTTESIWVWSRYRLLTGDTQFDANIAAAWEYVRTHPAYAEEGGSGSGGYYRVYNCGWAMVAEPMYRAATGDTAFRNYAIQCAQYVMSNPLGSSNLLTHVQAWAAGALYDFGVETGDGAMRASAVAYGEAMRQRIETTPSILSSESWAMAGGAALWGVLRSTFRENPGGRTWAQTYAPLLDVVDLSGSWRLAHTGWYALGHYEAWKATGDPAFLLDHRTAYDYLVAADGDDDGGIPSTDPLAVGTDESWVSNYLAFMGMELVRPPFSVAVGDDLATVSGGQVWGTTLGIANQRGQQLGGIFMLEVVLPGDLALPWLGPAPLTLNPFQGLSVPSYALLVPNGLPPGEYALRLSAFDVSGLVDSAAAVVQLP